MAQLYHDGNRVLQERFETRALADRMQETIVHDRLDDGDRAFIEGVDMFFLATVDEQGQPNCSYKGGDPGFVRIVDERTIAFPNYDGNGMYLSTGNLLRQPRVGLLFIDFERGRRLRLNGTARVEEHDPLLAEYPEAQFIVRVETEALFPNCGRYIHKRQLVERSPSVPHAGQETPLPGWKRQPQYGDVLPARDRTRLDA